MSFLHINNVFKRTIFLYVLLFAFIIFAVGGLSYLAFANKLQGELMYTNLAFLKQVKQNVDQRLRGVTMSAMSFTQTLEINTYMDGIYQDDVQRIKVADKIQTIAKNMIHTQEDIQSVYVYSNVTGSFLTDSVENRDHTFYDEKWIDNVKNIEGFFQWSNLRKIVLNTDNNSNNYKSIITLIIPYPLGSNQSFRKGAIAVNVDEKILGDIITNATPERLNQIFIVDANGQIVSHGDKEKLYNDFTEQKYMQTILASQYEGMIEGKVDGLACSIFYISSDYNGWKYVSIIPELKIRERFSAFQSTAWTITFVMLFIAIVAMLTINRWTYQPIGIFIDNVAQKIGTKNSGEAVSTDHFNLKDLEKSFSDILLDHDKMRVQIQENIPLMKWRLVMDILMGARTSYQENEANFQLVNINLYSNNFIVMVLEVDNQPPIEYQHKMGIYSTAIIRKMEEIMNQDCSGTAIDLNNGKIGAIMSFKNGSGNNILLALSIAEIIKDYMKKFFEVTITVGVGAMYEDMKDVSKSYHEASEAVKYKVIMGKDATIYIEDVQLPDPKDLYKISNMIHNILSCAQSLEEKEMRSLISRMFEKMVDKMVAPDMIRQLSMQLIMLGVKEMNNTGIETNEFLDSQYPNAYEVLNHCETIEEIQKYVEEIFGNFVNILIEKKNNRNSNEMIEKILEYIENNYSLCDLSLNLVASTFNLSISYLSRFFKESMGKNFLDYLIEKRMERAKILLKDNNIKINEIAEKVGYTNHSSFIRIFKKHAGMTPGEYRNKEIFDQISHK